ncbi:MAG: SDR family NAD(P)-dependent oxidoreductase [Pseudomonadales bacterium]
MDLALKGQVALVTGGTKGIGRAIAESFASEGANVAICARNPEEVAEAVKSLESKGVKAFGQSVDVTNGEALKSWIDASAEALGGVDCIVSNVTGGNGQGEDGWRAKFEGDVLGSVRCVEGAMPHLEKSKNASICFISTTAALEKFMNAGPYNAMKGALIQYAGALSQDLAPKGVRVNTISPGPIYIDGGAWANIKENMTPFYEATLAEIPTGRMGKAEEVADQLVFLASPKAAFTTGTNIVVDGGLTKRIQF